jgi:hypothetical protein
MTFEPLIGVPWITLLPYIPLPEMGVPTITFEPETGVPWITLVWRCETSAPPPVVTVTEMGLPVCREDNPPLSAIALRATLMARSMSSVVVGSRGMGLATTFVVVCPIGVPVITVPIAPEPYPPEL